MRDRARVHQSADRTRWEAWRPAYGFQQRFHVKHCATQKECFEWLAEQSRPFGTTNGSGEQAYFYSRRTPMAGGL